MFLNGKCYLELNYKIPCGFFLGGFPKGLNVLFQFVEIVCSTRPDLEDKINSMSILDNNPQKPVVRMANLCVVSSHTVGDYYN